MSRINVIDQHNANAEQKALLDAIQGQLGMVPNFLKVFANSPVALQAFLGLHGVANAGSLTPQTRERIALALAQQNTCEYCLSAHTAIGRKAGLTGDEIAAARAGSSEDAKAAVAVKLARSLVEHKGDITTAELIEARDAGYTDADIVEIITHVGMNLLTNILGKASRVDIDFPKVAL
ncbi:MAG TPA: carboxymuconolactone decarboxylase family protein [Aquabacterium sp.]|uniref:carboxymuconolactone decarboxylase family protein n=1 Tax=Aquabacterium sp. TaxID=1872578 RepID=UPI002E3486C1|nr:carboxymuconolactone decarboxylase family protein [Aquabacterium sp.]HEX5356170.1 carboxymuconolactone decarboxylase family protein [Aquabacterium sp.]